MVETDPSAPAALGHWELFHIRASAGSGDAMFFPILLIFTCMPALIYLLVLLAISRRAATAAAA